MIRKTSEHPTKQGRPDGVPGWKAAAALGAIYLIWGTPFLGRRIALESFPPLLMSGTRFTSAGLLMIALAFFRGAGWPRILHWKQTLWVGALLLLGGNGSVVLAQQSVPSGLASLFIGMVPIWIVLVDWAWKGGPRPTGKVVAGLLLGFLGILLLADPRTLASFDEIRTAHALLLLAAPVLWAAGSIYAREADLPESHIMTIGMQMFCGGLLLLAAGTGIGEWSRLDWNRVSARSVYALVYLIVVASMIGFNLYIWLLKKMPASRVATYAYVNPVVALFLGWKYAGEPVGFRVLFSAGIILSAVALVIAFSPRIRRDTLEPLEPA